MSKPTTVKTWNGPAPQTCDFCHKPIVDVFIDGATIYGPWANMCQSCYQLYGTGLGTGRGQKYQLRGEQFVKIAG